MQLSSMMGTCKQKSVQKSLDDKLNVSHLEYRLTKDDYFNKCSTILNSEKAALSKCELIYNNIKRNAKARYVDPDFGPTNSQDMTGSIKAMYKDAGKVPLGYPQPH